jgi:ATP-binding cassette subfamily F protein uup
MSNLLNVENISKSYGKGHVIDGVSLGINIGQKIGIVGVNGGGKSTLMRLLSEIEIPDAGRVTHNSGLRVGYLKQVDKHDPDLTIKQVLFGDESVHSWASDASIRDVLNGLFDSHGEEVLDRKIKGLSGGELRRTSLAKLLTTELDLLLLDEPTNHLDVEGVKWLADHLKRRKNLAIAVVTHDRWFLDEVSEVTWEVVNSQVEEYEGGYSAYVLAKAERMRQAAAEDVRKKQLIRKELAWLRRGAPARTSKSKFRVDAANDLIYTEPEPRNTVELLSFAGARLGKRVFELHDVTLAVGDPAAPKILTEHLNLNIAPGGRYGLVGPNGAGKTSLLRLLAGKIKPVAGSIQTGSTVKLGFLSQHLDELDPKMRVLEAVEDISMRVDLGKGRDLSASQLCERLGFGADTQWTPVGDLSGGERHRLQLTRILMAGPNVLFLDEPTNDFDVETLASLEDLLDGFAGTIMVVSHDRYFLERVCDNMIALMGDGNVRDLPRGIDQYLELRESMNSESGSSKLKFKGDSRSDQKELSKIEKRLQKVDQLIFEQKALIAGIVDDYQRLTTLEGNLQELLSEKGLLEERWLVLDELIRG